MKIKNNTPANLSVFAKSTRGTTSKKSLVVPGEATIELGDKEWMAEYAEAAADIIEAGNLEITVKVVRSEEEIELEKDAALEAARKLIAESEVVKPKPNVVKATPKPKVD